METVRIFGWPAQMEAHPRAGEAIEADTEKTGSRYGHRDSCDMAARWGGVGQVSLMPGRTAPRQGANQEDELVCRDSAVS